MIWYPYTQMKNAPTPYKIEGAHGVYLETKDRTLIDTTSSWWCMIHGYHHPLMDKAIKEQVDKLSHVMLAGISHEGIEKLSTLLENILPGGLKYAFFSDSGSVGVEVSLKMGSQYHTNKGDYNRIKILSLKNAYHGDTYKAMEVGDDIDYHKAYIKGSSNVIHIPTTIEALEEAFHNYGETLSLFIVEPLLQGAGGFRTYSIDFLKKARELCTKYDVVLIFDEVATGFGRTGYNFVSEVVNPDIVVLGKGLTGGYIGHAVTVTNHKIYKEFYSDDPDKAFMHGPTFMANPLACSAALQSWEIFSKDNYIEKVHRIESTIKEEFKNFQHKDIEEIRSIGAAFCIEVKDSSIIKGFREYAYDNGVFSRPFGKYIYGMLPYIINEEEINKITTVYKNWFK